MWDTWVSQSLTNLLFDELTKKPGDYIVSNHRAFLIQASTLYDLRGSLLPPRLHLCHP